jgi:hypothetical protein
MSTALQAESAATIARVPVDYAGMLSVATQLVSSGFLPEHIKTPGQAVAIIMAGEELGMRPMLALRSLSMVKGKIVVAADAQLALFKSRGGRAWFERLDEKGAILQLVHANGDKHTETFMIDDAKRAGLLGNGTWQKFPKAMLRSRCITAGLKSIGFEPTSGAYDPDEAQHFEGFTPSASAPAIADDVAESVVQEEAKPADRLVWAKSYPLPARNHKHFGEPIETRGTEELEGFLDWCVRKIGEAGADGRELAADDTIVTFKEALTLVLADRKANAEKDQTKLDLDPKNEVKAPVSTSVPVPPPGRIVDALTPKQVVHSELDATSKKAFYARVKVALESPAIDVSTRDAYKVDLVNGFKGRQTLESWAIRLEKLAGIAPKESGNKNSQLDDLF